MNDETDKEKTIVLDEEAKQLFESLGGIQARKKYGLGGLAQSLVEEQKAQDRWRIDLIDVAHLLGTRFLDVATLKKKAVFSESFLQLRKCFNSLNQRPDSHKRVLIRYRGMPEDGQTPEQYDFEMLFSNLRVDTGIVPAIVKRKGTGVAYIGDHLLGAFAEFSKWGVNNCYIRIPENTKAELSRFHICLSVLMQFQHAVRNSQPVFVAHKGKRRAIPIVKDEMNRPDINLTFVAGINNLNADLLKSLIGKVSDWMAMKKKSRSECPYTSVYNALFGLEKTRKKLIQPPIEINNIRWLIQTEDDEVFSDEKAEVARLVIDNIQGSPYKIAKVIKSVYGDDYGRIDSHNLGERITLSSELLDSMDRQKTDQGTKNEVLVNLHQRLDIVDDEVFDNIHIKGKGVAEPQVGEKGTVVEHTHHQLNKMVTFFKGRSQTHKKMKGLVRSPMSFTEQDYRTIAQDFRITLSEARELVAKLKGCFSDNGNFKKSAFNAAIEHFTQYEKKIFAFLWHHMKDAVLGDDRTAFLNSLQTLTSRMNQPKRAFKILLEDFCKDPSRVNFSDNKAMMLSNLIVHRYDALADIEMTPEDIVLDRLKLDEKVAKYAAWRIDKDQERFFVKVRAIHGMLVEALEKGETHQQGLPARHLLNLERELYIFLSLISGGTGKSVLRSGVREYGDPESEVYGLKHSGELMQLLVQNLRVVLHGLGSIGVPEDIPVLEQVKQKEEVFVHMKKDKKHRTQTRHLTEWVDNAIKLIRYQA